MRMTRKPSASGAACGRRHHRHRRRHRVNASASASGAHSFPNQLHGSSPAHYCLHLFVSLSSLGTHKGAQHVLQNTPPSSMTPTSSSQESDDTTVHTDDSAAHSTRQHTANVSTVWWRKARTEGTHVRSLKQEETTRTSTRVHIAPEPAVRDTTDANAGSPSPSSHSASPDSAPMPRETSAGSGMPRAD